MCNTKILGRKYTMTIGALVSAAFFFAIIKVTTSYRIIIFSCLLGCFINVY